jgi:hypothetical protein
MSNELSELIQETISYYSYHNMVDFVDGSDERLKHFVTDDFSKLLSALDKEYATL